MYDDIVHIAHDLNQLGYHLHATDITHEYLHNKGVKATLVKFPGKEVSQKESITFYCNGFEGCVRIVQSLLCPFGLPQSSYPFFFFTKCYVIIFGLNCTYIISLVK